VNGELFEYEYFRKLLAYHLVCIVSFFAIHYFVNTKNEIKIVLFTLLSFLLINAIFTILQANQNIFAWYIGNLFSPLEEIQENAEGLNGLLGTSIIPGLFGGVLKKAIT
jgi:hypothetical protein